jgi:adenylate kinase
MIIRRMVLAMTVAAGLVAAQPLVDGPVVLVVGPPMGGKTTQAAALSKDLGLPLVSAEDLVKLSPQAFAKYKQKEITGMEPITDPAMNKAFAERIRNKDVAKGMVVDGYPATKDHADYLRDLMSKGLVIIPLVVKLEVPDDVLRKRAASRSEVKPELFEQLLKDYHREFDFVHLYYPNADLYRIDGTKKPAQVTADIKKILAEKSIKKAK